MHLNEEKIYISVIGLGYVGLPLAIEFSKYFSVIGYDIDKKRVDELKDNYDRTNEIDKNSLIKSSVQYSSVVDEISNANVHIISVPSPVDKNNNPNFDPLKNASKTIGGLLKIGDIVIYESTVYPGATEEIFVPILEKYSKLKYNVDFFCGYSPERINPGDKKHTLTKIKKITSGSDPETAEFVDLLYSKIIDAGTYKVSSIAVAEAAKVIENTQRDVNIALINELAIIFNKLRIDTTEVLDAAATKWNFSRFSPGLVGGHCIGVDPYYLTFKAAEMGYHPEIILAGRRINDNMGQYVAENTIIELSKKGVNALNARIVIMGLTFKENCSDLRNTKVVSVIDHLKDYNCQIDVADTWANPGEAKKMFGIDLVSIDTLSGYDAVILAVRHNEFCNVEIDSWNKILNKNGVVIDVKSIYRNHYFSKTSFTHWRL